MHRLKLLNRCATYCVNRNRLFCATKASTSEFENLGSSSQSAKSEPGASSDSSLVRFGREFECEPGHTPNKEQFHNAIGLYLKRNVHRRGHVQFLEAAIANLKLFGVHKDLHTYKQLIQVLPAGTMVPTTFFQNFSYYAQQQDVCVAILEEMEWNGIHADQEIMDLVKARFGDWSTPTIKVRRQLYWQPKLRWANPYVRNFPRHNELPEDDYTVAKMLLSMMCRDPANVIQQYKTESLADHKDKTWVLSGQSNKQQKLLAQLRPAKHQLYLDGPYTAWLHQRKFQYFQLSAEADPSRTFDDFTEPPGRQIEDWSNWKTTVNSPMSMTDCRRAQMELPSMHEQPDGTVLALAITGTSSVSSAADWLSLLELTNANLKQFSVLIRLLTHEQPISKQLTKMHSVNT